jgi:hypothetical protein
MARIPTIAATVLAAVLCGCSKLRAEKLIGKRECKGRDFVVGFEFRADGTFSNTSSHSQFMGHSDGIAFARSGKWALDGRILALSPPFAGPNGDPIEVDSLSDKKLVLRYNINTWAFVRKE